MPDWRRWLERELQSLALAPEREAEILDELSQHLEEVYREARGQGMDPEQARLFAADELRDRELLARNIRKSENAVVGRLSSGKAARLTEGLRPVPGGSGWIGISRDVLHSLRAIRRNPAYSLLAIVSLAFGIGAATAVFSVVYGVLFRPLPYQEPDRLALVRVDTEGYQFIAALSAPELRDFREAASFESLAGVWASRATLTDLEEPEAIRYAWVTSNLFSMLGIEPILGRTFVEHEDQPNSAKTVIISQELWKRRYSEAPDIIGSRIELDDQVRTVVGVLAAGFRMPQGAISLALGKFDAFIPNTYWINRQQRWLRVLGRLAPAVTVDQAEQELNTIAAGLREQYSEYANLEFRLHVEPLHSDLVREAEPSMLALLAAVAFFLLISNSNVAGLLLARFRKRSGEMALHLALGASRWTIIRRFLIENLFLTLAGGLLGLLSARLLLDVIVALGSSSLPRLDDIRLDVPVLLVSVAATLGTGIFLGSLSALRAASIPLSESLRGFGKGSEARGATRLRNLLVVSQIAVTLVLLVGAGLMIRTFLGLKSIDPGFQSDQVLTFTVPIAFANFKQGPERWNFYQQMQRELEQLPGVTAVGGISMVPLAGGLRTGAYAYDAESEAEWGQLGADYRTVTPGYFETLGVPVLSGRTFDWADSTQNLRAVLIDRTLADQAWPDQDPAGRRIKLTINPSGNETQNEWVEVLGVIEHIRMNELRAEGSPQIYRPFWLDNPIELNYVLRSNRKAEDLIPRIRQIAADLGSERPVHRFETLAGYLDESLAPTRFVLFLLSVFSATALLLAAVGLYGIMSYSVSQQTREFGIRIALGAPPKTIQGLVFGRAIRISSVGIVVGMAAAFFLSRFLANLLYGVEPTDPLTYALLGLLLAGVSLLAALLPARRATRVDPLRSLRTE